MTSPIRFDNQLWFGTDFPTLLIDSKLKWTFLLDSIISYDLGSIFKHYSLVPAETSYTDLWCQGISNLFNFVFHCASIPLEYVDGAWLHWRIYGEKKTQTNKCCLQSNLSLVYITCTYYCDIHVTSLRLLSLLSSLMMFTYFANKW